MDARVVELLVPRRHAILREAVHARRDEGQLLPEDAIESREYDENNIRFDEPGRSGVELRGPVRALAELGEDPDPKELFQEFTPTSVGSDHDVALLQLRPDVRAQGITLEDGPARIHLPKATEEWVVRTITVEVALVCLDPDRTELLERWRLPPYAQEVRLDIVSRGLASQEEMVSGAPVASERLAELEKYVRRSVYVFADLAELAEGESTVVVRYGLRDQDWREWVGPILLGDDQDGTREWSRDALQLRLDGDARILLEEVPE